MLMVAYCLLLKKDEKIAKESLELNIHYLANYFRKHQLNLNASKPEFVRFSKPNDQRNETQDTILLDNKLTKNSNECKNLGLTIDSSLSFTSLVKQTIKKMTQALKTIDSIGTQFPQA